LYSALFILVYSKGLHTEIWAKRLNSQQGQERLLYTSSYESDIEKVHVVYFILAVPASKIFYVLWSVYETVTHAKQNSNYSFINTFMLMYLCRHTAWRKCYILYII